MKLETKTFSKMITLNDLKENKAAIVEMIAIKADASRTKELMTIMVDSIGCRAYEGLNALLFAKAVIEDNKPALTISDNSDYYIAESRKQLGSSMRY